MIEAQGRTYRHTKQNICPIITHISSPFARPPTHTPHEPEEGVTFTRPSIPTLGPGVIQTNKVAPLSCHPTTKTAPKTITIALVHDHPPTLVTLFQDPSAHSVNPFPIPHIYASPISGPLFTPRAKHQPVTHTSNNNEWHSEHNTMRSQLATHRTCITSTSESNIMNSPTSLPTSQNTSDSDPNSDDSTSDQSRVSTASY